MVMDLAGDVFNIIWLYVHTVIFFYACHVACFCGISKAIDMVIKKRGSDKRKEDVPYPCPHSVFLSAQQQLV